MAYSIGWVSKATGLSVYTLRYYETKGLVLPQRDKAGRRAYEQNDLARLAIIKNFKIIGTPLEEVEKYFHLIELKGEGISYRRAFLLSEKKRIALKIQQLEGVKEFIDDVLIRCGLGETVA